MKSELGILIYYPNHIGGKNRLHKELNNFPLFKKIG